MLDQKLQAYAEESVYPFHMPGHKRLGFDFPNPYTIDITEIHGFDNLHQPTGEIRELMASYASLYHSHHTYLLVNGATAGNLAAIFAACKRGEEIAVGRNSHKSVYHGIYLRELTVNYLYPQILDYGIQGEITEYQVDELLRSRPQIRAVLLTSPTYEGISSNLGKIVEVAHKHQVPVIVDSAHGAHLGITDTFPEGAVASGADIVITSIHKTLPAFTQSALLHYNSDGLIRQEEIEEYLQIFQTSSPSYILMAGMSKCCRYLQENQQDFVIYKERLERFYEDTKHLKKLHIYRRENMDPSKIVIAIDAEVRDFTGDDLSALLRQKYQLELEMASYCYVLAMTSVMDSEEGFRRLTEAVSEIDEMLIVRGKEEAKDKETRHKKAIEPLYQPQEKSMELYEAKNHPNRVCALRELPGKTAATEICLYPPGIPLVVPGEIITEENVAQIQEALSMGLNITGISQNPLGVKIVN